MSALQHLPSRLIAQRYFSGGLRGWSALLVGAGLARLAVGGLAVSVALLVVVLSVMNGFERELRERILAFVPHVELDYHSGERAQSDYQQLLGEPQLRQITPFAQTEGLLYAGGRSRAINVLGLQAQQLPRGWATVLATPQQLQGDGILLSAALAEQLKLAIGERLTLLLGSGAERAATIGHRQIVGLFNTHTELDQHTVLVAESSLASTAAVRSGWQIQLNEPLDSRRWSRAVYPALSSDARLNDWRQSHGNLYQAIKLSRQLVVLLILLTVAIAAFNVVAMLVMSVERRRGDIAILQTLGLQRGGIVALYSMLALRIGSAGVALGLIAGLLLCQAVAPLFAALQGWLEWPLLSTEVYPIDYLPVDVRTGDLLVISVTTLLLTLLAAIYPARRASAILPATELRSE